MVLIVLLIVTCCLSLSVMGLSMTVTLFTRLYTLSVSVWCIVFLCFVVPRSKRVAESDPLETAGKKAAIGGK